MIAEYPQIARAAHWRFRRLRNRIIIRQPAVVTYTREIAIEFTRIEARQVQVEVEILQLRQFQTQ